jgi:hypothetical protein
MAEIQTNTESGEMTQRFIEFVMMQAQNAALFLGQVPHPHGEAPEINLDLARMFIDQLVMIREKTRNNLSDEERTVLSNAISNLQMVFVEVAEQVRSGKTAGPQKQPEPEPAATTPTAAAPAESTPAASAEPVAPSASDAERESKKRFTKSYGS